MVLRAELESGTRPGRCLPLKFVPQQPDRCGSAALSEVLTFWGAARPGEAELATEVFSESLRASLNADLAAAARRRELVTRSGRSGLAELRRAIETGCPAVVMITLSPHVLGRRHFLAVKGVDSQRGYLLADDGRRADTVLRPRPFRRDWASSGFWALYCWPPDRCPAWSTAREDLEAGLILERRGRLEEAADACRRAAGKSPGLWQARFNLGNATLAMGRPDEAVSHYRSALELAPDEPDVLNNTAAALLAARREPEESERLARRATDLSRPGTAARVRAAHTLGLVLLSSPDPAAAAEGLAVLRAALAEAEGASLSGPAAELRRDLDCHTQEKGPAATGPLPGK